MQDDLIQKVITLVLSSERVMPAHYTTGKDGRTQSFCINFEIAEDDEYNMAGNAWGGAGNFGITFSGKNDYPVVVKFGEDIMIGAYIITKLGHKEKVENLVERIIKKNIENFQNKMPEIKNIVEKNEVNNYFIFCKDYGNQLGETKI